MNDFDLRMTQPEVEEYWKVKFASLSFLNKVCDWLDQFNNSSIPEFSHFEIETSMTGEQFWVEHPNSRQRIQIYEGEREFYEANHWHQVES